MATQVTEYQGKPLLEIETQQAWKLSFGLTKAALILENISDVLDFVTENDVDEKYSEQVDKFREQIVQIADEWTS